ncbi:ATP-binding protein [Actinocatenispora sera]|uniref:ATP-binding protein n=1 Tax=Actinocatenispora sera TaxID=390989 RepID=UPI0012ECE619|nr:LuxR C-terminal-related transcriptional regulator [Actinocatenispora sera]
MADLAGPDGPRVISLVGPAGVGTSRLAREFLQRWRPNGGGAADRATDGPCADSRATDLRWLLRTVSGTELSDQHVLVRRGVVLLDDADRHRDAVATLVRSLLPVCPQLRFVIAGREPLHLYGEQVYPVGPLPVGTAGQADPDALAAVPAIELFVDRARSVRPDYRPTPDDYRSLAAICRLLDGLPLAIELAAARMTLFRPKALLRRLGDGLDVLEPQPTEVPVPQRSLRSAIGASLDRLGPAEGDLLDAVSVCSGGFDLAAVEALTGIDPASAERTMETLTARSLVQVAAHRPDGEPRFRMLHTTRRYAVERLRRSHQADRVTDRHAAYYLDLARTLAPDLSGPRQGAALAALADEHENLRHACHHLAGTGRAPAVLSLILDVSRYVVASGRVAATHGWLGRQLAGADPSGADVSGWLMYAGLCACLRQDRRARTLLTEVAARCRRTGDERREALALGLLGQIALMRRQYDEAARRWAQSRACGRARGMTGMLVADGMATLALLRGDLTAAARLCDRHASASAGDTLVGAVLAVRAGTVAGAAGDPTGAQARTRDGLRQFHQLQHRPGVAFALESLAVLAARGRDPRQCTLAARLVGAAETIRATAGSVYPSCPPGALDQALVRLRDAVGEPVFRRERLAGRRATLADAVGLALGEAEVPAPATRHPAPPETPLTARELQVARLVAAGHTNRQVAVDLDISEWTAINHLRHVMRKLDCRSRVGVAQWILHAELPLSREY